eukprot:6198499-Pleurochrysis_carterae.AAC.1
MRAGEHTQPALEWGCARPVVARAKRRERRLQRLGERVARVGLPQRGPPPRRSQRLASGRRAALHRAARAPHTHRHLKHAHVARQVRSDARKRRRQRRGKPCITLACTRIYTLTEAARTKPRWHHCAGRPKLMRS